MKSTVFFSILIALGLNLTIDSAMASGSHVNISCTGTTPEMWNPKLNMYTGKYDVIVNGESLQDLMVSLERSEARYFRMLWMEAQEAATS
jgi:hypothetical protein